MNKIAMMALFIAVSHVIDPSDVTNAHSAPAATTLGRRMMEAIINEAFFQGVGRGWKGVEGGGKRGMIAPRLHLQRCDTTWQRCKI